MTNKEPNYWMAVGRVDNWNEAFRLGNIWGLEPKRQTLWESVQLNDVLLFYAMRPVAGVIGYGTIKTKFRQTQPFWPEEIKRGEVIWPLRFEINVGYCVPPDRWEADKISSEVLRFRAGLSFRKLEPTLAIEVVAKFKSNQEKEVEQPSLHKEIKDKLVEIGSLQNYIVEEEYSFDLGKLDVVWRRVQQSVPTYVFEVHVKGDLYHDLTKLKHAFDLWNSHIFLVGNDTDQPKIKELIRGSFHEISGQLKFIDLMKVRELHKRKKALIDLETELGI
jgi:predicted RNA-binding protein